LREIFVSAADVHMGLQAYDPTQLSASDRTVGFAHNSLNGAMQLDRGQVADRGRRRSNAGISFDDPDGDGRITEHSEGDIDAVEFYMLNAPPPARLVSADSDFGRTTFLRVGCASCHVESWYIEPRRGQNFSGDRRSFDLSTRTVADRSGRLTLVGTLRKLWTVSADGAMNPALGGFSVKGVYSDFKHWNLGPHFYERRFDGTLQRTHRTAPLWGVGTTAPYGHSGNFPTLDSVIRAHQGAALAQKDAYLSLSANDQMVLIAFLRSLVLFPTDRIPADIDGDARIAPDFRVRGVLVGHERFNPLFLFRRPPLFAPAAVTRTLDSSLSGPPVADVDDAFGLNLEWRKAEQPSLFPHKMDLQAQRGPP
jgi:hypothetical protein